MRISSLGSAQGYISAIDTSTQQMATLEQQIETGKTINQPSDNPGGTEAVLTMNSLQSALTQYSTNMNTATGWLGTTSDALTNITNGVQQAYSLAVQGASASTTQAQRDTMATQIAQIQSQLVTSANSQSPSGAYVFGGQVTNAAPFSVNNSTLTYGGDTNSVNVELSASTTMTVNTPGSPLLTNIYNSLQTLQQNLLNGNVSALSNGSVTDMQNALNSLQTATGVVGAKSQTVTTMTSDATRRQTELTTQISNIQDANVAETITKYQSASTAYQAALQLTAKGFQLSLSNFIT